MRDLSGALKRRGLLAGVAALVGTGLAKVTGPDRAEAAGSLIIDANNAATASTLLLNADFNATGPVFVVGNRFQGVLVSQPDAIQGATTGVGNAGVRGSCSSGYGIFGESVTGAGVRGRVVGGNSGSGSGVVGVATGCDFGDQSSVGVGGSGRSTDGVTGARTGVLGITGSTGIGVEGWATRGGTGIRGLSNFGGGPDISGSGIGVEGRSGSGFGVRGDSTSGVGVYGSSLNSHGCGGTTTQAGSAGLFGVTSTPNATAMLGVHGLAGGLAGYFQGNVYVSGTLTIATGAKSAAVKRKDGSMARMYCQESPEPWFEDFGTAQLQNGQASVALSADFDEVVDGSDYRVFLTPIGAACGSLYVARKGPHRFEVQSLAGNAASGSFDYRVVARRRDDVGKRLEKVDIPTMAPIDVDKLTRSSEPPRRER